MKKRKLKIALVFGGTSAEREVSLASGKNVAANLDPKKYEITPVEISPTGQWLIDSAAIKQIAARTKTKRAASSRQIVPIGKNDQSKIDLAFLALHGPGGEDGTVQGVLESLGIKYTGSGVLASALAMDKARTKRMVASDGIKVAPHIIIRKGDKPRLKFPCVIKPNRIGSSFGVSIAHSQKELKQALKMAFQHDDEVIIEPYLKGREFTVPILGNRELTALPVIEIVPKVAEFFDHKSKYDPKATDEIVPALISKSLSQDLQTIALKAHRLLGCRGVSRTDFIVTSDGKIYFLEINTIPGMTENSLVPKAARAVGISYSQLLDRLIKLALEK